MILRSSPILREQIDFNEALDRAQEPLRSFMFKHTREKDISIFYSIAKMDQPRSKDDVPTTMLAAAYVLSELKTGFSIGFLIYIPFSHCGHGSFQHTSGHGYDDAASYDGIHAV